MKLTSKVNAKGQVTIPKPIRETFGIKSGDIVVIFKGENGRYIISTEKQVNESLQTKVSNANSDNSVC